MPFSDVALECWHNVGNETRPRTLTAGIRLYGEAQNVFAQ
jgi:hypothetical protein